MTEYAVYLNDINKFDSLGGYWAEFRSAQAPPANHAEDAPGSNGFQRLYLGVEHCPHLLPGFGDIARASQLCRRGGLEFILVTPLCFEITRPQVEKTIEYYAELETAGEVVVNDWGIFEFLISNFKKLTPVIGRLLSRQKRLGQKMSLSEPEEKHFSTLPLTHPRIKQFLRNLGVRRLELDYEKNLDLSSESETKFRFSLYLPYSIVSVTRYCAAAYKKDSGWQNYAGCERNCRDNIIYLDNREFNQPLIARGCARYREQEPYSNHEGVDRLVFLPEIF